MSILDGRSQFQYTQPFYQYNPKNLFSLSRFTMFIQMRIDRVHNNNHLPIAKHYLNKSSATGRSISFNEPSRSW